MILETGVWRQFPERKSTTHHVALLTSAQSPLPSLSVSGVVTDHLLCGTRHLLSPVPRMATKISLRCANDRPVNVCPDNSILSSFSLTHTFTTMSWSTHAAGKNICSVLDIWEVLRRWDLPLLAKNKYSNFNPRNPIPPSQYWFSSCSHRSLFLTMTATWRQLLYLNVYVHIPYMQKTVGEKYPGGLLPYLSYKATWGSL